jgi:hypothetical protein
MTTERSMHDGLRLAAKTVLAGQLDSAVIERVDMAVAEIVSTPSSPIEPPGVWLWDLRPNACLHAVAEPEPRQHRFCGEPVSAIGSPWCAEHHQLCTATIPK